MTTFSDPNVLNSLTQAPMLVLPEVALVAFACLLIAHGMLLKVRGLNWTLALFGLLTAIGLAAGAYWIEPSYKSNNAYVAPILATPFADFVRWLTLGVGTLLLFLSSKEARYGIAGEYYGCLFVALAGCSLTARANDLVTLFVALEMISIPTYVLLYLPSHTRTAQEAASKYFLLSILSSAILLFGLSYLYGLGGSTNITALVETFATEHREAVSPLAVLAMVLTVAGLCFRLAAVPFHYYAPDVYQGGPTAVIAQLAVVPKIAGFVVLARLLGLTAGPGADLPFDTDTQIPLMLWVIAAVTMTLGNLMALIQDNLKRLLAYSGIAHAGYMLLGFVSATATSPGNLAGMNAVLVYLAAYSLMTLGVFAVFCYQSHAETVDDLAGFGRTHPVLGACLAIALLSLIGLPLTAGFSGKFLLFFGLIDVPSTAGLGMMYRVLAVVAAVNAAIGAVYYLRILAAAYLRSPLNADLRGQGRGPIVAAFLCAVGTVLFGIWPGLLLRVAKFATGS